MTIAKIDLVDSQAGATSPAWNVLKTAETTPQPILDNIGVDTGWTMRYDPALLPYGAGAGFDAVGVGDAVWADDSEAVRVGVYHNTFAGSASASVIISGPASLSAIKMIGSYDNNDHVDVSVGVNSETPQVISTYDVGNSRGNNSEIASFPTVSSDAQNEYVITWAASGSSRGYLNAIYLEGLPQAAAALDAPLQMGAAFSGTYSNFAGIPTGPVTISDGTRSVDVSVTISDNGDGDGTFSGTMPGLPASGASSAASSLIYPNITAGSISVTLTDPGA